MIFLLLTNDKDTKGNFPFHLLCSELISSSSIHWWHSSGVSISCNKRKMFHLGGMGEARLFLHLHAVVKVVNYGFSRNLQWENYDECLSCRRPAFNLKKKKRLLGSVYLCHFKNVFIKIIRSYFTWLYSCFPKGVLFMQSSLLHCQKQNSFKFYKNRTECFD